MPHLIIEYSANVAGHVDIDGLVGALHDAALASGIADLDALRTRAVPRDHYAVADRHPDNAFVAVTARLGAGRSLDDQQRLLGTLIDTLDQTLGAAGDTMMLSVEYQEIDPTRRINRNHLRPLVRERAAAATATTTTTTITTTAAAEET
jgi:5-carboxymethyl-2-hydroxymuconate isomerase